MFDGIQMQNGIASRVENNEATYSSSTQQLSPQEEALQSLCKQLLKSRLFRGYYLERRFVNSLNNYRDIISLQRSEKELEKLLLDMRRRLEQFYAHSNTPNMWIGVTHGPLVGTTLQPGSLDTYLWVELDELAFGQYWFSIKSIRFRQNEIIIKLKLVREVEDESTLFTPLRLKKRKTTDVTAESTLQAASAAVNLQSKESLNLIKTISTTATLANTETAVEQHIDFQDFLEILQNWGYSIKQTIYEFMSQDINKENIKNVLRFFGLLVFSLVSAAIAGIKFLGIFTLRFIFEFCRLTHVLTPIILKIIDFLNKIVGGFYILIAMIWRDTLGKRNVVPAVERTNFREVEYNRPLYRAIQYDVRKQNMKNFE